MVIITKNPLYSVLFLVSSFLWSSLLILLTDNEFLALFFLIIYLGAIAILFLFVVMMLDIKYNDLQMTRLYLPAGTLVGGVLFFETQTVFAKLFSSTSSLQGKEHNIYDNWYENIDTLIDVSVLGQVFYTQFLLQILIAGLILYVAVVGVAFLTITSKLNKTSYGQSLTRQIARKNVL